MGDKIVVKKQVFNPMLIISCCIISGTMFFCDGSLVEGYLISKWYVFISGAIVLGCVWLLSKYLIFRIDLLLGIIVIFVGYLLSQLLAVNMSIKPLILLSFILLIVIFRSLPQSYLSALSPIIILVCLLQAFWGIGQYIGLCYSDTGFIMAGSFDNPAGFAASLTAGLPFCFTLLGHSRYRTILGVFCMTVLSGAIVLSGSRTGIFALVIIYCLYFISRYDNLRIHPLKILIGVFLGIMAVLSILFLLRPESAMGRLFIWRNTLSMIADKPLFGHGPGAFNREYMTYQADYFAQNPDSQFGILADNVAHPFNEFLLLAVEYGLIGFLLLVCIIGVFVYLRPPRMSSPYFLCLLSIAVFSCFSYPLRYAFIGLLIAISFGSMRIGNKLWVVKVRWPIVVLGCGLIGGATFVLIKDIKFEYTWGKMATQIGYTEKQLTEYANLYEHWNGDIYFLYNYGAVLNYEGYYEQSNFIMAHCLGFLNDYDVQLMVGDNYNGLGVSNMALYHYELARSMLPNRFVPLYRMMLLYQDAHETEKSVSIAHEILQKEIKVPSATISLIRNKAQEIIDTQIQ